VVLLHLAEQVVGVEEQQGLQQEVQAQPILVAVEAEVDIQLLALRLVLAELVVAE
jgi:hypothetical protein